MGGIGRNIRTMRKDRKISQYDLGQMLGYSQRAVSDWEKEACEPNIETIRKIVRAFNVSYDDLFEG